MAQQLIGQPGTSRAVVVKGLRTPFVKAGGVFGSLTSLDLGAAVVRELVERADIDPAEIDQIVFGQAIPTLLAPSIAREVGLASALPRALEAHTVSRACATSLQAFTDVASAMALGVSQVAIAGGTESMSDVPIFTSRPLSRALVKASRARTLPERLRAFAGLKPRDIVPVPPAIAEYSTGLTMGESAEKMAKENRISRTWQDEIALASHQRAAAAWKAGVFDAQVMHVPVPPAYTSTGTTDDIVRPDTSLDALAKLRPVFDRAHGSVTAGNSSPLTDGAAALVVMREDRAKALGLQPLGALRAFAYAATDPGDQLLQGPAYAAPLALDRAGMTLKDIDLVEMHEAFAAQVASNLQAFSSSEFARKLGRSAPLGEVDPARLNVHGGSIALGHPFGATGARIVMQTLDALSRRNGSTALCTVCAAGGLGAALVLERV
ncbi:MAG TPA: acetyl-CoA C-acyltransferase FadI [Myxococcaceae bacterium]|nr:acetyl-CoA C-acyltransferase FadI [Myxococcaceae bacterium]